HSNSITDTHAQPDTPANAGSRARASSRSVAIGERGQGTQAQPCRIGEIRIVTPSQIRPIAPEMSGAAASPRDVEPQGDESPSPVLAPYLICTLPRSGSTLLAQGLWQTWQAGQPDEYFWGARRDEFLQNWGLPKRTSDARFLERVLV